MRGTDTSIFSDCVLSKDNRLYRQAVIRESMFWRKAFDSEQKRQLINKKDRRNKGDIGGKGNKEELPSGEWYERLKERYYNKKLTGSQEKGPADFLRSLKHFDRALSLGAGRASFEFSLIAKDIVGTMDMIDFSKASIDQIRQKAVKEGFSSRINPISDDLNFINLSKDRYDLIICRNILHHMINLEHVLYEVNAALKKGGVIFIEDYIGENKFQWSQKRSALIKMVADMLPCRVNRRMTRTTEKALMNYLSPFESIRSEEIPALFNARFRNKIKEIKCGEAFHLWEVLVQPHQERQALDSAYSLLVSIDDNFARKRLLKPTRIIGFYHKNTSISSQKRAAVKKWSPQKIRSNLSYLSFSMPIIKQRIKSIFSV